MIKINELRVGNFVTHIFSDNFALVKDNNKVQEILKDGVRIANVKFSVENVYSIPLTPEILEKCGFKKLRGLDKEYFNWGFTKRKRSIEIDVLTQGNKLKDIRVALIQGEFLDHIFYLHQLQNLYFALTGEELEINL